MHFFVFVPIRNRSMKPIVNSMQRCCCCSCFCSNTLISHFDEHLGWSSHLLVPSLFSWTDAINDLPSSSFLFFLSWLKRKWEQEFKVDDKCTLLLWTERRREGWMIGQTINGKREREREGERERKRSCRVIAYQSGKELSSEWTHHRVWCIASFSKFHASSKRVNICPIIVSTTTHFSMFQHCSTRTLNTHRYALMLQAMCELTSICHLLSFSIITALILSSLQRRISRIIIKMKVFTIPMVVYSTPKQLNRIFLCLMSVVNHSCSMILRITWNPLWKRPNIQAVRSIFLRRLRRNFTIGQRCSSMINSSNRSVEHCNAGKRWICSTHQIIRDTFVGCNYFSSSRETE